MKKYHIHTFGCQMNVHDSEKIAGIMADSGLEVAGSVNDADVIVLNTCSIRQKAEQKFYSELGRLELIKKNNPAVRIAVAGCIAQQKGDALFKRFPYVDFIFGPDNIDNLQTWVKGKLIHSALNYNPDYHNKSLPVRREGRVRAWVSIMYGCNNFCSYCVVPFTRGRERSRSCEDIYDEISLLATQGFKEVTLLGQNVNSYGRNLSDKTDFPDLLKKIHDIDGIQRIRFVTSHPRDLSEKLVHAMKGLPKVCDHIHLPLQSGSSNILNLMNRGYTFDDYMAKIDMLRNAIPDIAITTDIIAGFPGESDADFKETLQALYQLRYDGIFAFKYSVRPDTNALQLPDHIDEKIKSLRLSEILKAQEDITFAKNKLLEGSTVEVLTEGVSETDSNKLTGRTQTNKVVNFYDDTRSIGSLIRIRIIEAKQHSFLGELIST